MLVFIGTLPRTIKSTQNLTRLNENEAQRKINWIDLFKGAFKTFSKCLGDSSKNL